MRELATQVGKQVQPLEAARTGDICALLVPNYSQAMTIRAELNELQTRFGGQGVAPLHLLCQRFRADATQLENLRPELLNLVQSTAPLAVHGQGLAPFYSTFRARELLKCRVAMTDTIERFITALNQLLLAQGIEPLNIALPEWVTMLEDIHVIRLQPQPHERLLFVGQRLMLSELRAPGRFKALNSFALAERSQLS